MSRYLVGYYSWTGKTAKIAKVIAEHLSADLEEIHDVKPRRGPFAFAATAFGSVFKRSAPILPPTKSVAEYDVVILGCPVWASNIATPMRAYILRERPSIKRVGLFCTLGGNGGKAVLSQMAALCGRAPQAELIVEQSALVSGTWRGLTETFAQQIRKSNADAAAVDAA